MTQPAHLGCVLSAGVHEERSCAILFQCWTFCWCERNGSPCSCSLVGPMGVFGERAVRPVRAARPIDKTPTPLSEIVRHPSLLSTLSSTPEHP